MKRTIILAYCLTILLFEGIVAQSQSGASERLSEVVPAVAVVAADGTETDWTQFRGPDRSGVSPETGFLRSWPEDGPKVVWRRTFGEGFSGVVTSGDYFYTLVAVGEAEFLGRFRVTDGTELWRLRIGDTFHDGFGSGPRATPTVDGDLVYAQGGRGKLVAVDAGTGELVWGVDLHTPEYGFYGPQLTKSGLLEGFLQLPQYGYAASPLVEGEVIIVGTGAGNGKNFIALDKKSGEIRWSAIEEPGYSYSSPMAVNINGQRLILIVPRSGLTALLPTGVISWQQPWPMTFCQPVFVPPDKIFISTTQIALGSGVGGAMVLRVRAADGQATIETVWEGPIMRNYANSSVFYEDHIYGFDNATLRCIAADTGELRWARRRLGKGSLVIADGLLFLWSDQGLLTLADADPEAYEQKGQVQIFEEGRTWTPPTLARGRLYLRGPTDIVCLDLR